MDHHTSFPESANADFVICIPIASRTKFSSMAQVNMMAATDSKVIAVNVRGCNNMLCKGSRFMLYLFMSVESADHSESSVLFCCLT